jgi:peroxiredoxin Q/BCP
VSAPALAPGLRAPGFSLPDQDGNTVTLASLKGQRVVLYFYPKDHTPGCTQESCDFRDSFSRLEGKGVRVFGVSRDTESSHRKFKDKLGLPFPLLSDVEGRMCEAFGVWKEKSLYGRKYMGIERTTVVIGADGKIERVYPKVSVKGHVDQVIRDLNAAE